VNNLATGVGKTTIVELGRFNLRIERAVVRVQLSHRSARVGPPQSIAAVAASSTSVPDFSSNLLVGAPQPVAREVVDLEPFDRGNESGEGDDRPRTVRRPPTQPDCPAHRRSL
jgi:hypothetical protein